LITTPLGPVAALAWNDAIQTLFQQYLGTAGGALADDLLRRSDNDHGSACPAAAFRADLKGDC
jgi:uncharacterized protein DUF5654